jgi:hypothetical protein
MLRDTGRLVLTPDEPSLAPQAPHLARGLTDVGLIGGPIDVSGTAFYAGPKLLSLVSFTGCAVSVATAPDSAAGAAFTHVRFVGPYRAPRLRYGRNTRPPRCPHCRSRLETWRTLLHPERDITCPSCARRISPAGWDWRLQGGIGRVFIDVEEVFPGEAVPTATLMQALAAFSGATWRYFYLQRYAADAAVTQLGVG